MAYRSKPQKDKLKKPKMSVRDLRLWLTLAGQKRNEDQVSTVVLV